MFNQVNGNRRMQPITNWSTFNTVGQVITLTKSVAFFDYIVAYINNSSGYTKEILYIDRVAPNSNDKFVLNDHMNGTQYFISFPTVNSCKIENIVGTAGNGIRQIYGVKNN